MKQFQYKIYTLLPPDGAIDVVPDWQGEDYPKFQTTNNLDECLAQPYRVAGHVQGRGNCVFRICKSRG